MKRYFTFLLLIIFYPAGLILLWKNKEFAKKEKIVFTLLFAIVAIALLVIFDDFYFGTLPYGIGYVLGSIFNR